MNGLDPIPHLKVAKAPPDSMVGCPVCKTNFAAKDGYIFLTHGPAENSRLTTAQTARTPRASSFHSHKKARIAAGFFVLPASASAEPKGYARTAITITAAITAIIRLRSVAVAVAVVWPRSVAVASIMRTVVTIAIVAIVTPM